MIIECYECGGMVSTDARCCPACGAPPKRLKLESPHPPMFAAAALPTEVTFGKAMYLATCSHCAETMRIQGAVLSSKEEIKCPSCGVKIPVSNLRLKLETGQAVRYRRFQDLFSFEGRIGVADYWLSAIVVSPLFLLLGIVPVFGGLAARVLLLPLAAKRLKDHGISPQWLWLELVAIVLVLSILLGADSAEPNPAGAVVLLIVLLCEMIGGVYISFDPGSKMTNRYGPPPSMVKRTWG